MTDTERNFMQAIIERPDCDLPRLAFADWLEESGQADRAEFIRVQCAIPEAEANVCFAQPTAEDMGVCGDELEALRKRERELLTAANAMAWGGCPALWDAGLKVSTYTLNYWDDATDRGALGMRFERGFVSEVRARLSVLVGAPRRLCTVCHGESGVRFGCTACGDCDYLPATPSIAREIAKAQPVTKWVATDKEPEQPQWGNWRWYEVDDDGDDDAKWHIGEMYEHLPGYVPPGQVQPTWATRELALAALSAAIAKHAKGECK